MARTEREILAAINSVINDLSPENLSCDGELSRSSIKCKEKALKSKLRELESELGRVPSDNELTSQ